MEYGPESVQVEDDLSPSDLTTKKNKFYLEEVSVSEDKQKYIERTTRSQASNSNWHDERRKRITSSNFGVVMKRRASTKVSPLVRQLIYKTFSGNKYTRYGLREEMPSRLEYANAKQQAGHNYSVHDSGLVIDKENNHLACSPDGVVYEGKKIVGAIEIKNVLKDKPITLETEAKKNKNFCCALDNKGKLYLKKTHQYYYQIQGVVNILEVPWIDFVLRTKDPYQIHIERIKRDKKLWEQKMVPKLTNFYQKAMLPELAAPREGKYPGIREPGPNWVIVIHVFSTLGVESTH